MSEPQDDIPSVVDRARPVPADAPVFNVGFIGDTAVFVLGEEALLFVARDGEPRRVPVHGGGILASACDGQSVLTGGDDGHVVITRDDGAPVTVGTDARRRWIDQVALGPGGAMAWSAGKQACVLAGKSAVRTLDLPSTPGALAFAPKGTRLAIAHYNGVTLWFPNAQAAPEVVEWKGSHLGASFSPDGRFLVTSMQEATLHGWRLADRKDMQMSGYAARVRSIGWSADGKWLATSGSTQAVLWPFQAKDGPMGKSPKMLAPAGEQAEVVACHPKDGVVAIGYADGLVLIARIDDGAEILARRPAGAAVTALAWDRTGKFLAFGTEDAAAGVIHL